MKFFLHFVHTFYFGRFLADNLNDNFVFYKPPMFLKLLMHNLLTFENHAMNVRVMLFNGIILTNNTFFIDT